MHISGLVLTLDPEFDDAPIIDRLRRAGPFTVGDRAGQYLGLSLDAPSSAAAHHWHQWLSQFPGVIQVDVVFVSFPPDEGQEATSPREFGLAQEPNLTHEPILNGVVHVN